MACGTTLNIMKGAKQGDLMPTLFILCLHNAMEEVQQFARSLEFLFAFLDDVFILSSLGRTREIFNLLKNTLPRRAGIHLHTGKTRVWKACGEPPLHPTLMILTKIFDVLGTPLGCGVHVEDR